MYRVLNIDPFAYSERARTRLTELGRYDELELSRDDLLSVIHQYDVLICRFAHQVDRELIDRARKLKAIGTNVTGVDHIDVYSLDERNIKLFSLRAFPELIEQVSSTAELTWGLLIALLRKIVPASGSALTGHILRDNFVGTDLKGKTLGILGLGRIGKKVAKYGKAFDMRVIAYTLPPWPKIDGVEVMLSEDDFLSKSHVLTIHLPLDRSTTGYLNNERMVKLPDEAVIINTSRSAIICEETLIQHLESGHLAGAALDVYNSDQSDCYKQVRADSIFDYAQNNDNLLLTPHIGGATAESWELTEFAIADAVTEYFQTICPN